MGRRKIEIKPIKDERNRSVTLHKRKAGLFKKAHELSVLCSVDIGIVICGHQNKVFEYSSTNMSDILDQYSIHASTCEHKGPNDFGDKDDEDDYDESFERDATPESVKTSSHKSHSRQSSRQQKSGTITRSSPYIEDSDAHFPKPSNLRTPVRVENFQVLQGEHPVAQRDDQPKNNHGHTVSQSGIVNGLAMMSHSVELPDEGIGSIQSGNYPIMSNYPMNSHGWPVMQQQGQYPSTSQPIQVNHPSVYNQQNTSYNRQDSGRQSAPPFIGSLSNESHTQSQVQYGAIPPTGQIIPNNVTKYHSMFTPVSTHSSALAAHFKDVFTDVSRSRSSNDLPILKDERPPLADLDSLPSASSASDTTAKRPKLKVEIPRDKNPDGNFTGSGSHGGNNERAEDSAAHDSRPDRESSSSAPNSAVHLPPPSPLNAYPSSAPSGTLGHFVTTALRPEQTPISALPPSRFAGDLLPSPSSFYPEWSASFGRGADAMLPSPLTFQNPVVSSHLPHGSRDFGDQSSKRAVAEDRNTTNSETEAKRQKV